jgi:hypothetical protein
VVRETRPALAGTKSRGLLAYWLNLKNANRLEEGKTTRGARSLRMVQTRRI